MTKLAVVVAVALLVRCAIDVVLAVVLIGDAISAWRHRRRRANPLTEATVKHVLGRFAAWERAERARVAGRCGFVMKHGAPCVRHAGHKPTEHRDSQGYTEAAA